jgi:glycyl-tRNA synthetase beta chain
MSPKDMEVADFQDYLGKISKGFVIIDYGERKAEVEKSVKAATAGISGTILEDPELLSKVTNMVEFPYAVCGSFDKAFLNIPDPVLITAMKEHQKYFSVYDQDGRLMPNFVAINNTVPSDESVVRKGHERVLRARLADADFFFKEDRKRPLEDRLEDLKGVIYKAELGTSFDKVQRFTKLAEYLAEQIAPDRIKDIRLASALCKCDLVTEMVMEFPSLQGVIGKEYARLDGHPEDVCIAILEHYMPVQAESELPGSLAGSIVGMADRMDTIVGSFALGLEPTGTADPYALRRQTLAILRIVRDKEINISIPDFVDKSASALREKVSFDLEEVKGKVINFIKDRFKNILLSEGIAHDLIEAVLTVDFGFINQTEKKIEAIKKFREFSKDFEVIATAFKRVRNITKGIEGGYSVSPGLFKESSEKGLWRTFDSIKDEAGKEIDRENYFDALNLMVKLGAPLDEFFSQVMVMTEDKKLKENRIGMLKEIHDFVIRIADISRLSA